MRQSATAILWLVLAALGSAAVPRAELKLHTLFGDHMVLQADLNCPVWGTAEAGDEISVSVGGQKKTAKADGDGKWMLKLDPAKAGGPHEMTVTGKTSVTVKDVLFGEVWICSGQSNMEMTVQSSNNFKEEQAAANFPNVRHFAVKKNIQLAPVSTLSGDWKPTTPDVVGGFTAVGYFFGRELNQKLNVPIGLIHTSWGGTAAQLWVSLLP